MFWYILIALFLFTLTWILVAPVLLFVNTERSIYSLALPGIFKARVVPANGLFMIRGSVFFIPYRFNPFKSRDHEKKVKKETTGKKRRAFKVREGWDLGKNMLHALRIRKLYLDIDTDDYSLNAWLIPAFSAVNSAFSTVNSENIRLQANFEGNASLLLDMRTRLGAMIWAFLKSKYKSMSNQ